jgi:hypothetical protein
MIPIDETQAAAKFLATTWNLLAKSCPEDITYTKSEPKLTELLSYYLKRLQAASGLTGFWVNEDQEPYFDGDRMRRTKKDITYYSNASKFRLELIFEFKKLSHSSLATYRGRDGMRRFVDGNYAPQKPLAVMVGILLTGGQDDVIMALYNSLSQVAIRSELQMVQDPTGRYIRKPPEAAQSTAEFDTEHRRPADKAPPNGTTTIAHIFLICNQ